MVLYMTVQNADSIDSGEYCMVCEHKSHNAKNFWNMKLGEYMRYETNRWYMMGLYHLSLEQDRVSECVTQDSGLGDVLDLYLHSNANIRYGNDLNMGIGFTIESVINS